MMSSSTNIFERIGSKTKSFFAVLVEFTKLSVEIVYWIVAGAFRNRPINQGHLFEQMVFMGVKSIGIVFFVTLLWAHSAHPQKWATS